MFEIGMVKKMLVPVVESRSFEDCGGGALGVVNVVLLGGLEVAGIEATDVDFDHSSVTVTMPLVFVALGGAVSSSWNHLSGTLEASSFSLESLHSLSNVLMNSGAVVNGNIAQPEDAERTVLIACICAILPNAIAPRYEPLLHRMCF
tara:strand:+ start:7385 stop:7825 length:441 start_codon:yes stop_codon:yes gene_type:complete